MQNNKTSVNDRLTKEFYETFWNEIKSAFLKSLKEAKEKSQSNICHCQTVIKLVEKKIEIKGTVTIGDQYHYLTLTLKLYQKLSPQS